MIKRALTEERTHGLNTAEDVPQLRCSCRRREGGIYWIHPILSEGRHFLTRAVASREACMLRSAKICHYAKQRAVNDSLKSFAVGTRHGVREEQDYTKQVLKPP